MADIEESAGKSPHAFMREALGVKSRLLDDRRAFLAAALRADDDALASGEGYAANEVDAYFEARAAERAHPRPRLRAWRK